MAKQCTNPKRPRNSTWFKEKMLLVQAQEEGQVLDEEQLEFLADLGIPDGQAIQITILQNAAFQIDDLDAYDSDCDDISSEKRFLWLIFLVTVQTSSSRYHNMTLIIYNDMINQSVQETQNFEQSLIDYVPDNEITSDSNIISYDQYLQQTQNTTVQDTYSFAQHNSMIISMFEQMSEQMFEQMSNQVTHWDKANQETKTVNESLTAELERYKERIKTFKERLNTLTKQVKEKESLLQTFAVFKKESKEKERNNIDKEIDLENKIKELDNIVYKLGQSAQIVHMLTKPQVFYDDTYKQALGYQNLFYLKKAQRIKPTLYDAIVISKKHDVIYVVDEEETLVLKEESRSKIIAKQNDPISKEKKINISLINHNELNKLAKDFGKRFVLQKKMFAEQAFWLPLSNPKIKLSTVMPKLSTNSTKIESMKLEAMVEESRIFKCWFHYHTTNGHQFTMSNRNQELASPEQTTPELASPKQTTLGKDISNPLISDSLLKTIWLSMHHAIAMKHWLFQSKRLLTRRQRNSKVTKEFKFIKEQIKE
ncbi:hypothetical protein Tco_0923557 [Tanacetum coccineum]|uniref:Uncharacterized protein n=1 Tax=Tanacetum coccineum TaxID=301880 RepID=A0ABQ5D3Q7_9ASTR